MSIILARFLPKELVDVIKLYTGEGFWRNGKYIHIHRIPKNDHRYNMLRRRPMIKQVYNDYKNQTIKKKGSAWFKLYNGKFVVINVGNMYIWDGMRCISGYVWEMNYNETKILRYLT